MNVKQLHFGGVMWIMLDLAGTVITGAHVLKESKLKGLW